MSDDFRINVAYAEKYNKWREKEELQKLKDKYGDVSLKEDGSSSSSSESEDDEAEALTEQLEADWQSTLAAIKKKDPRIYDKNVTFYHQKEEGGTNEKKEKKTKEKPMFLKDYERKVILEKGGKLSDEEENVDGKMATAGLSYHEEQERIRKELIEADDADGDSDDDELLTKRQKTEDEQAAEDKGYELWSSKHEKQSAGKLAGRELSGALGELWTDEKLDEGGRFLRDYLVNERYLEKDDSGVPSYAEIVQDDDDDDDLSNEDEALEKQETFERKYNFRFEEPDTEFIKSYPRTLAYSVRRKDDRRVNKRQYTKMRKIEEKNKKREELAQLKNLKRREIMNRLDQLKEVTGNASVAFTEADFDGDFDAATHDKMMQKMFSDDYYDQNEDTVKPKFAEDEEIDDGDWNNWQVGTSHYNGGDDGGYDHEGGYDDDGPHCDDEDFNMDADYDPEAEKQHSGILGLKSRKRRKNKLAQALSRKKPIFDPASKTFEEYFDEYYKLDYEDIIDDLPCRFTYRHVVQNDFGLSTDDILGAKDKELNAWVSLKKMSQFRTDDEEKADIRKYHKKGKNVKLKYSTLTSLQQKNDSENAVDVTTQQQNQANRKKRKKKKAPSSSLGAEPEAKIQQTGGKRKATEISTNPVTKKTKVSHNDASITLNGKEDATVEKVVKTDEKTKAKKKKKRKRKPQPIISEDRLKAYGINPKKFKYMKKGEKKS